MSSDSDVMKGNKVAIILTQGFADWEYSFIAGTGKGFYGLDIQFFAPKVGEIVSQGGLRANVSKSIDEIITWSPAAVVIVGGTIWETDNAPEINQLLNNYSSSGGVIAGICGGTLALARSGLLNNVAHTSNDIGFLTSNVDSYAGNKHYQDVPSAVVDNRIITAAGTAPVSFTAYVFESVGVNKDYVAQFREMMAAELRLTH